MISKRAFQHYDQGDDADDYEYIAWIRDTPHISTNIGKSSGLTWTQLEADVTHKSCLSQIKSTPQCAAARGSEGDYKPSDSERESVPSLSTQQSDYSVSPLAQHSSGSGGEARLSHIAGTLKVAEKETKSVHHSTLQCVAAKSKGAIVNPQNDVRSLNDDDKWKLHLPKSAGTANVDLLLKECHPDVAEEIRNIISKEDRYRAITNNTPVRERARFNNRLDPEEVDDLLKAGMIRSLSAGENTILQCKLFAIPEPGKKRKRLIIEPRDLNKLFRYNKTILPNIRHMNRLVSQGKMLAQWDLSCWFYQIPLTIEIQKYFGVCINGEQFAFTCLPMGFVASVFVAQSLSEAICKTMPNTFVYIDNIFTSAKSLQEANALEKEFEDRCKTFNIKVKESASEKGPSLDILGIRCNATDSTLALADNFITKHRELFTNLTKSRSVTATVREIMRIIGTLFRGVYVLQLGFHRFWKTLRTASKIATFELDDSVEWEIDEHTVNLAHIILTNTPVKALDQLDSTRRPDDAPVIATDASHYGYGFIWAYRGRIIAGGGKWPQKVEDNMPELEATAIAIAIERLRQLNFRTSGANLHTDSLTVIQATLKGHSTKCPAINVAITMIVEDQILLHHVASEDNPADNVSRGVQPTLQDIMKMDNLC